MTRSVVPGETGYGNSRHVRGFPLLLPHGRSPMIFTDGKYGTGFKPSSYMTPGERLVWLYACARRTGR